MTVWTKGKLEISWKLKSEWHHSPHLIWPKTVEGTGIYRFNIGWIQCKLKTRQEGGTKNDFSSQFLELTTTSKNGFVMNLVLMLTGVGEWIPQLPNLWLSFIKPLTLLS